MAERCLRDGEALIPILENHARDARDYPHIRAKDLEHLERLATMPPIEKTASSDWGEPVHHQDGAGKPDRDDKQRGHGSFEDELVKNFLSDYAAEHLEDRFVQGAHRCCARGG